MGGLSVYVHVPFCIRKCRYCDFLSFTATSGQQKIYVEALMREIELEAPKYAEYVIDTVFIGGGTPSVLAKESLQAILDKLHSCFSFAGQTEVTIEVNPGTVDEEKLKLYRKAGVNRLSIGTQSVRDEELACLGRIHTAREFYETYQLARKTGFENINVDIMAALPGQSVEAYMYNLKKIVQLKPEHISAYGLIIEEGTCFYEWYGDDTAIRSGVLPLPSEEEERRMYEETEVFLNKMGYHRYEISNYAKAGRECIHNKAYWQRKDYVGFGIGAASMVQNVRWKNLSEMDTYIGRLGRMESVREDIYRLSEAEQMEEFMFLGLRLTGGVSKKQFLCTFGKTMDEIYGTVLRKLEKQGLIDNKEHVRLTPYGRDISNYVMAEFLFDK